MMEKTFHNYCHAWSSDIDRVSDPAQRMAYFQQHLPALLGDRQTVQAIVERLALGRRWPDVRRSGFFSHEVLLYLDPASRFSVRIFLHAPRSHTWIHDHTSWGVSGTPGGRLSVVSYDYEGDIDSGRVHLRSTDRKILGPGEVDLTLPWDEGIHKTGTADNRVNVMISVYGRPGRRLYINRFDEQTGRVDRLYSPGVLRRMLAKQALAELGGKLPDRQ